MDNLIAEARLKEQEQAQAQAGELSCARPGFDWGELSKVQKAYGEMGREDLAYLAADRAGVPSGIEGTPKLMELKAKAKLSGCALLPFSSYLAVSPSHYWFTD